MRRISIITISYNAESCIERTILSVEQQEVLPHEYIFVDGGSKDTTNQLIKNAEQRLKLLGVRVVHISEADRGIADAFNKGIRVANGEIMAILNAGDEMLPGALSRIMGVFDEDIDVLFGNVIWHNENNGAEHIRKSDPNLSKLLYHMHIMHPATYVRKATYDKYGLFDINYNFSMDKELLYRFYVRGAKFKYVDECFAKFVSGGKSDSINTAALIEAEKMAMEYGEKLIKVRLVTFKKIVVYYLAHIYRNIKQLRK